MNEREKVSELKKLLDTHDEVVYLRGEEISELNLFPQIKHKSNYLVFLVSKNNHRFILKVQWDENRDGSQFESEMFFYHDFVEKHTFVKKFVPHLFSFSLKKLNYFEIEYLYNYKAWGEVYYTYFDLREDGIQKIVTMLSQFHIPVSQLPKGNVVFPQIRNYHAFKTLLSLERRVEKSHIKELPSFYKQFLTKLEIYKEKISSVDSFILNDRNPGNILLFEGDIKMIDFDKVGIGNPAIDYTLIYLHMYENIKKRKVLIHELREKYNTDENFLYYFHIDLLWWLLDFSLYWESFDIQKSGYYLTLFEIFINSVELKYENFIS